MRMICTRMLTFVVRRFDPSSFHKIVDLAIGAIGQGQPQVCEGERKSSHFCFSMSVSVRVCEMGSGVR